MFALASEPVRTVLLLLLLVLVLVVVPGWPAWLQRHPSVIIGGPGCSQRVRRVPLSSTVPHVRQEQ
jgi:uncharacterized iron-regulated membrane protein